ncbi:Uncharacterised protein [Mycobacterium tuberculosis]|nr:Uncharacterised protein [Mycobacterium tuberculosis]
MTKNRHSGQAGRNRVLEMLTILQLGLCGRCGRAHYATRRTARHAARIATPGTRLRAYQCGDTWHLTTPPGRPQFIAPPVTLPRIRTRDGLDLRGRGERPCRTRRSSRRERKNRQRLQGQNAFRPKGGR